MTVTFVVADSLRAQSPQARFFDPIASSWPGGGPPAVRPLPLDALLLTLDSPDNAALMAHLAPLLIVLGPEHSPTALTKLVDALRSCLLPAVVLVPRAEAATRRLQGGGVIIEPWSAAPLAVASMLLALGERQSTILELSRELAIHTRTESGMRGEIDRMHDELNLAATVQREMLPRQLPSLNGVSFAALFRPASYVSGDIYDVVQLDDEHLSFFIADAVGHGVPAALMTMVISRSLRMTHRVDGPHGPEIVSPAQTMTRLNDELCRATRDNHPRFSTAVYGVIHARTRVVRLVGAGHPPPLRVRSSDPLHPASLRRVPTDGPLLGVFPDEQYDEISFTLDPAETLLLYSDGFETAFAPPEPPGPTGAHRRKSSEMYLDELAALPWPGATGSASEALDRLAARIDEQAGSLHQIDDVTALAVTAGEPDEQAEPASERTMSRAA